VLRQPGSAYRRRKLPLDATPSEFYEDRSGGQQRGQAVLRDQWQSALATLQWDQHQLVQIRLHPVDLGMGLPTGQRGRPVLADSAVAQEVLARFQRCSEPFGTHIQLDGNTGVIRIA
jgi:poly-gamma-glutamate synthesis protein (capsule biosynthesis protein)